MSQRILFVDTETTGLPQNMNAPYTDTRNWPHILGIAWELWEVKQVKKETYGWESATVFDQGGWTVEGGEEAYYEESKPRCLRQENYIVQQRDGVVSSPEALKVHGITPDKQYEEGTEITYIIEEFLKLAEEADIIVAHNVAFDRPIIVCEMFRLGEDVPLWIWECTKEISTDILKLPPTERQRQYRPDIKYKMPSLDELYKFLFEKPVPGREENHGAGQDTRACRECYFELKKRNLI